MKALRGNLREEELVELVQIGKINMKDYVEHHSDEMTMDYHNFCKDNSLDSKNENSAIKFLEHIESLL